MQMLPWPGLAASAKSKDVRKIGDHETGANIVGYAQHALQLDRCTAAAILLRLRRQQRGDQKSTVRQNGQIANK
ncbi:MAG: hypothetical protein ACREWI_16845 [Telluria sp.]